MRKKDRTTNLQKEFTEQLEAVGKRLRSKWLYHIARELSINVVTSIALIVLFAVVQSEWVQEGSDAIKDLDNAIVLDPRVRRSLVYKLTGRLNYGVEPLRCGRRLIRFVKKQTNAAKRPVGIRMAACKEGSAD
jgi:hypothetical protein